MVLQTCIALTLLSCFPTDNCAVDVLGVVLLSLILALEFNRDGAACSSSCLLYRQADRDREVMQSNYQTFNSEDHFGNTAGYWFICPY